MKTILWLVIGVIGLALANRFALAEEPKQGGLQVEIHMFSGRPDPIFTITDPILVSEIMASVSNLPSHPSLKPEDTVFPNKSGFVGFTVKNASAVHSEIQSFDVDRADIALSHAPSREGGKPERTMHQAFDNSIVLKLLDLSLDAKVISREEWAAMRASRMPGQQISR